MCSIITLRSEPRQLKNFFPSLPDSNPLVGAGVELRAHGYLKKELAPVVFVNTEGEIAIENKFFSLCPSWSKDWPFAFETYNARLSRPKRQKVLSSRGDDLFSEPSPPPVEEYIYSVPSFRDAFNAGQTCLVPISGAVESCYFGESAGNIVRFVPESEPFIFVLGLWNDWVNPLTGEIIPTFTLLTDAPDSFVFRHGHDRGVIAVDRGVWSEWLVNRRMSGKQRLQFVRENRVQPRWQSVIERTLKAGWQRRCPSQSEIAGIEVWQPAKRA